MFEAEMKQYVLPNGTAWTTSGYDGAVTELPPGAWEMPKSATGKQALTWMLAFGRRLPLATRVQQAMEKRHLREPHFYVRTVGVRPALQGQGLGTALMQQTLERADSAGLPTYLEASSERSAALYERLGFLRMDVLELSEGGPTVWPMRRPPAGGSDVAPPDGSHGCRCGSRSPNPLQPSVISRRPTGLKRFTSRADPRRYVVEVDEDGIATIAVLPTA
jgi:GNAT superfamily N-acetyltransferase